VKRFVRRIDGISQLHGDPLQEPLPVAQVRSDEHDGLTRIQILPRRRAIDHAYVRGDVRRAHRCRLQHLHQDIAKILEKALMDGGSLRRAHARKDFRELVSDDLVPMPNYGVRQEV
jgi:hypothetical protein